MDTVDDLHQAEDMAGTLAGALAAVVAHIEQGQLVPMEALRVARTAVDGWATYCRATCFDELDEAEDDPDFEHDDCCGCPCHDRVESEGAE